MSRTTQCPNCGVVLNLPEAAAGRRLRCPKCQNKFQPGTPGSRPPSTAPGVDDARATSSLIRSTPSLFDEDLVPMAEGDLRETFDLPSMTEENRAAPPPAATDAAALFKDDEPAVRRRPKGAEARAQSRRCACGGVVPAGMSLCSRCGLDLDTGRRELVDELMEDAPTTAPRSELPPIGVMSVGGAAFLASLLLACVSFMAYFRDNRAGMQYFGLVCLFGLFASVQFLRGKSAKPLMVALMIGAAIDIVALIVMPAWAAANDVSAPPARIRDQGDPGLSHLDDVQRIASYQDRLEATGGTQKITWGIILLLVTAAIFIYLTTNDVRRHFERHRLGPIPAPF